MITIEVYQNAFLSCIRKYKIQVMSSCNNKGNSLVLFPFICDFASNLIFNLLETIRWRMPSCCLFFVALKLNYERGIIYETIN